MLSFPFLSFPFFLLSSALIHAGYSVSGSHSCATALKTSAPSSVVWDVMRCYARSLPQWKNIHAQIQQVGCVFLVVEEEDEEEQVENGRIEEAVAE